MLSSWRPTCDLTCLNTTPTEQPGWAPREGPGLGVGAGGSTHSEPPGEQGARCTPSAPHMARWLCPRANRLAVTPAEGGGQSRL